MAPSLYFTYNDESRVLQASALDRGFLDRNRLS